MNEYYEKIKFVKSKIIAYLNEIFKVYGNELLLRLEDYNLLQSQHNCIESSTATGFIMEEFIVSKLETYTRNHGEDEVKVNRIQNHGTQTTSYDCFVNYKNVFFMINVKVDKGGNTGVSAINVLHNDYVQTNHEQEKSFIVLKTHYHFGKSKVTDDRKIIVDNIVSYALEEIDFSSGHKQDYRNWKKEFNTASGRLQISNKFYMSNKLEEDKISYKLTCEFIEKIKNN